MYQPHEALSETTLTFLLAYQGRCITWMPVHKLPIPVQKNQCMTWPFQPVWLCAAPTRVNHASRVWCSSVHNTCTANFAFEGSACHGCSRTTTFLPPQSHPTPTSSNQTSPKHSLNRQLSVLLHITPYADSCSHSDTSRFFTRELFLSIAHALTALLGYRFLQTVAVPHLPRV